MRMGLAIVCLCLLCGTAAGQTQPPRAEQQAMPPHALPYMDSHACPFEGCAYRAWTARKTLAVYDTWKETRRSIAKLSAGQTVEAVDGVVITHRPGVIRIQRDLPEQGLKRGDTILVYTYQGEGASAVWVKGKFYDGMDLTFAAGPRDTGCSGAHCAGTYTDAGKHVWWARIRTPH